MSSLKIFTVVFTYIFLFFFPVSASDSSPKEIADKFMVAVSQGETKKAMDTYMHPKMRAMLGQAIDKAITDNYQYAQMFGGYENSVFVKEQTITARVRRLIYILNTPLVPIGYEIIVFKTSDRWSITSFQYDTDLSFIK